MLKILSLAPDDDKRVEPAGRPMSSKAAGTGAQTLLRGLALLEAVAEGVSDLERLAGRTGLTRSTAHRLLTALTREEYVSHEAPNGYRLGPKLLRLGFQAHGQLHLPLVARPHLEWLASLTMDTVHLSLLDGTQVVYVDKVSGSRRLQLASSIGGRMPAQSTGLGKAHVSALPEEEWPHHFVPGLKQTPNTIGTLEAFIDEMRRTRDRGYALDMEENEHGVRCIAAPIRDASNRPVAAVSLASASIFLTDERIPELIPLVLETARRISHDLGGADA
jgi:DNA-binding IclR family transcriptional regulator